MQEGQVVHLGTYNYCTIKEYVIKLFSFIHSFIAETYIALFQVRLLRSC